MLATVATVYTAIDPCCFSGVGHRSYTPAVAQRAGRIGGGWDLLEDATHDQHTISPYALSVILHRLGAQADVRSSSCSERSSAFPRTHRPGSSSTCRPGGGHFDIEVDRVAVL
jgi:hypothetical protein